MATFRGGDASDFDFTAVEPEDAVEYFRRKGYEVGFDWRDVWQDEHARAFTVAKAMTLDLLTDIRNVVDEAIADGIAFEDFQSKLEPILRARGWWGRQLMEDPLTGKEREVQLGSARRLGIIYDTNLRMSYSAGSWAQVERTKKDLPYLRYWDPDPNPRPQHLDWSGTVLPADDPWWDTHYPPNGWHCKCLADSLSESDLGRYGYQRSATAPPSPTYTYENPRTGEVSRVPVGIDPNFAYNPGKAGIRYAAEKNLAGKLATSPPDIRKAIEGIPAPPPARINPTLDEAIAAGQKIAGELGGLPAADDDRAIEGFRERMLDRLKAERGLAGVSPTFVGTGRSKSAQLVRQAAERYPNAWVRKSNDVGKIVAHLTPAGGRGYHRQHLPDQFGNFDSVISSRRLSTATHEFGHRIQAVAPGLNDYFRKLHLRRTEGEPLRRLRDVDRKGRKFDLREKGRKDKYADVYFGKEYANGDPLEVLPMTYQALLAGGYTDGDSELIKEVLTEDPEILHLGVGLLFNYAP